MNERVPNPDVHLVEVHYTGRVQGVGFRYAAFETAREFEVTGFVENLSDGRVHLEVEGKPAEVDAYLVALEDRMHGYIRKGERAARRRAAQFSAFEIR